MGVGGGKKLIPPTNLQESNNEESWSTNNNGSSYTELLPPPPPPVSHEANGTFGPSFIDPYLNEFQDSYPGFDATFAPGTPQTGPLPQEPQLAVMKKRQRLQRNDVGMIPKTDL